MPSCSDPDDGADTSCPPSSLCWSSGHVISATMVTWSLHDQCHECTFPRQNDAIIAPRTIDVYFRTDGTFQRDPRLEIYKVNDLQQLKDCDISEATLVGRIASNPASGSGPPPSGYTFILRVSGNLTPGANYFVSLHAGDSISNPMIPNNCEQGARLIVHRLHSSTCGYNQNPALCSNRGPCLFDWESQEFHCRCPGGYKGFTCEEIDECFQNTACGDPQAQGRCVDGNCDFSCSCIGGFSSSDGGGKACDVPPTSCSADPCLNGGTCTAIQMLGFTCQCLFPFQHDLFCGKVDFCSSNPCRNGAVCTDGVSQYSCLCAHGYTGQNCDMNVNDCSSGPCLNAGICTDGLPDATCSCSSPWTGKFCQVHSDDCLTSTCVNGATCIDGDSSHSCSCPAGYTGSFCETSVACSSYPCQNLATCRASMTGNNYTCECAMGFTGNQCEVDIDECSSNPCSFGGTCENILDGYICYCPIGLTGVQCNIFTHFCFQWPPVCQNGGTCEELRNGPRCHCPIGVTGECARQL